MANGVDARQASGDLTATAPDLSAFPRRAWAAALRRVLAEMPDAALDYGDPRGRRGAARRAGGVPRAGARRGGDAGRTWSSPAATRRGCGSTCRALSRARRDAGRGRGPVARRLLGDDPLGGAGGRRAAGGRGRRAARRRCDADAVLVTPAHQFPTGAVLAPGAAAGAAGVGRDRDRGRLRLRVPLRPRAGRHAAAARAGPRRLPRHGVEDARARAAARLAASRRRRSPRRSRASAGRSTPAARRSTRAPTPACSPPARSTATCAAPAASTASAATRWSRRSPSGSRTAASRASPPGCTCCCGCRRARTRRRWWRASRSGAIRDPRPRRLPAHAAPRDPALVIGYGRLPRAAIDGAVAALGGARSMRLGEARRR